MSQTTETPPRTRPASAQATPVALAASAGGIEALSVVLALLPAGFPAPVIVLEHLLPDHVSVLPEILDRRTVLRVKEAKAGDRLLPGVVYVAPPDSHTTVRDGQIALDSGPPVRYVRPSADRLFESLADAFGDLALVVVLSGTGSDGAAGVRAIKKAGGTVIAQDVETAAFPGMPRAAIDTGAVDAVLSLSEIPAMLVALVGARGAA